jgi:hypothetical protein
MGTVRVGWRHFHYHTYVKLLLPHILSLPIKIRFIHTLPLPVKINGNGC